MNKRKKNNKITTSHKISIGAISVLGVVGGWNIIGHMEQTEASADFVAEEMPTPVPTAIPPLSTPWPTIQALVEVPRLDIKPLPTRAEAQPDASILVDQQGAETFSLAEMPSAAPFPTLAPLPAMPEYVPPPPPPEAVASSNGGGGGGGGNVSEGS